jgi:hypothetical protein
MIMSPAAGWGTASCACAASSATRSSWSPSFARGAGILRTSCRPQLRCLAHGRDRGLDQGRGDTSMPNRILRGRCLCGAIQYTVNGEPRWCAHCHCDDCRHHTGSAFATFIGVDSDSFTLSDGEFGRIESSAGVYRSFCAKCGTPMAYERNDLPNEIHLYVGTLEQPQDIHPTLEVFCRDRLPWLKLTVDGPSFDGLPDADVG